MVVAGRRIERHGRRPPWPGPDGHRGPPVVVIRSWLGAARRRRMDVRPDGSATWESWDHWPRSAWRRRCSTRRANRRTNASSSNFGPRPLVGAAATDAEGRSPAQPSGELTPTAAGRASQVHAAITLRDRAWDPCYRLNPLRVQPVAVSRTAPRAQVRWTCDACNFPRTWTALVVVAVGARRATLMDRATEPWFCALVKNGEAAHNTQRGVDVLA